MLWNPEVYGHYTRFILRVKGYSIAMDSLSIVIRAEELGRRGIVLREGNYSVWSIVLGHTLRENKLWVHVLGTAVPPPPVRVRAPGIAAAAADPILDKAAVAAVAKMTQEQVDADQRKIEGFEAASARANALILFSMEQKDVLALYGHDSPKQKWYKLKAYYNLVTDQMATEARAKLFAFKMGGEKRLSRLNTDLL